MFTSSLPSHQVRRQKEKWLTGNISALKIKHITGGLLSAYQLEEYVADMEKLHFLLHPACSTNVLLTNNHQVEELRRIDMQLKFCNLEGRKGI